MGSYGREYGGVGRPSVVRDAADDAGARRIAADDEPRAYGFEIMELCEDLLSLPQWEQFVARGDVDAAVQHSEAVRVRLHVYRMRGAPCLAAGLSWASRLPSLRLGSRRLHGSLFIRSKG